MKLRILPPRASFGVSGMGVWCRGRWGVGLAARSVLLGCAVRAGARVRSRRPRRTIVGQQVQEGKGRQGIRAEHSREDQAPEPQIQGHNPG